MNAPEALHTAARRYCIERADEWRVKYAEIVKRDERPARYGLLKKLGLTTQRQSQEGSATFPRYKLLDAILIEIERGAGSELSTAESALEFITGAAKSAFESEARPPDLVVNSLKDLITPEGMQSLRESGPMTVGIGKASMRHRDTEIAAMAEERDRFLMQVRAWAVDDLAWVEPLSFRRTLAEREAAMLLSRLNTRWQIEGPWFDRPPDQLGAPDSVAFNAQAFFTKELVKALQDVLRAQGVNRLYELRENPPHLEIDLDLLRPWYDFREGFWFDNSLEWLVFASHEGAVTVSGARLLPALQGVWRNWADHLYAPAEHGIDREVGPGISSVGVAVEPPPGWDPPS